MSKDSVFGYSGTSGYSGYSGYSGVSGHPGPPPPMHRMGVSGYSGGAPLREIQRMTRIHKVKKTWFKSYNVYLKASAETVRISWFACCVCKEKTLADIPWYKRVYFMEILSTDDIYNKDGFHFKHCFEGRYTNFPDSASTYAYTLCSEACLNILILAVI